MHSVRVVFFALGAAASISSGCIPALVPPMRVSMGPSMSTGIRDVDSDDYDRRRPYASADLAGAEVRVSIEPLNLVGGELFEAHRIDLGVGYVFATTGTPSQRFGHHGVFVETGLGLFAIPRRDGEDGSHRFAFHVAGEVLDRRYDAIDGVGYGARLSLDYERGFGFAAEHASASRRTSHSPWVGGVRGDIAFGVSLGLALRTFGGDQALTATVALTMRLPGVAGALVFTR